MRETTVIRVLVVDDHGGFRRTLRLLLEAAGLDVVGEACDGLAGIAASRRCAPDAIVTDYQMPALDGLTMARQIKAAPRPPAIVMLTGSPALLDGAALRAAGVDRLFEKGCSSDLIVAALQSLVAQGRQAFGQAA